jgi:protein-S-isoprenylcysteine O-methyltransferase Ste14
VTSSAPGQERVGLGRSAIAVIAAAWGTTLGGAFGCLLPYLLGDWQWHQPLPYWAIARVAGGFLIAAGMVPIVVSFVAFGQARGTPLPVASPPRLVVRGFYRYVRNPIYVGFLIVLAGEALLFGSRAMAEYAAIAWCIGAAAVRWYEEPALTRKFGPEYAAYRSAVRAWIPRLRPWVAGIHDQPHLRSPSRRSPGA